MRAVRWLDDEGKERLRNLTEGGKSLSLQFSQNLLKENKAFTLHITDEAQLDGLPETAREAAALAAKEAEKEGWLFTLDYPRYSAVHDLLHSARAAPPALHGTQHRGHTRQHREQHRDMPSDSSTCAAR